MHLYLSFTSSSVDAVWILKHCLASILISTKANRLRLNKTSYPPPGARPWDRLGVSLSKLDGVPLVLGDRVCDLGIFLYPAFSLKSQIAALTKSTFNQVRLITQSCDPTWMGGGGTLRVLLHMLVISKINYHNTFYIGLLLTWKLQQLQNWLPGWR